MSGSSAEDSRVSGLLPELLRRPVTGITCAAAVAISIAFWSVLDVSALFMRSRAFGREPWRLVTAALVHANVVHLAFNVSWVWPFGRAIETRYGALRTAMLYLVLAVAASTAEYAFARGGVGLSGVVYGQFGFLWVAGRRDPRLAEVVKPGTVRLFVIWFFVCLVLTATRVLEIANIAHAAGWGLGMAIGSAIGAAPTRARAWYAAIGGSLALLVLAATVGRTRVNFDGAVEAELAFDGFEALQAKDHERAAALLERAVARDASQAPWWGYLGCAYFELKRESNAGDAFERAYRLDPSNATARRNLAGHKYRSAFAANERGDSAAAEKLYRECVALQPNDAAAWRNLGITLQRDGKLREALTAYHKSLELDANQDDLRDAVEHIEDRLER